MFLKFKYTIILLFIISCKPVEFIKPITIDYSTFENISINANQLILNNKYDPIFSEDNIEYQLNNPPSKLIIDWINENFETFGNENKFVINILDASISKKEIENTDAKKFEDKEIFQYEVFLLVEYELYSDSDYLIANTTVETTRSTTSRKFISLNENELIINDLLNNSLKDFTNESKMLIKTYMNEYLK